MTAPEFNRFRGLRLSTCVMSIRRPDLIGCSTIHPSHGGVRTYGALELDLCTVGRYCRGEGHLTRSDDMRSCAAWIALLTHRSHAAWEVSSSISPTSQGGLARGGRCWRSIRASATST